jgi:GNAT superfamily N-acetyltransferase
MPIPHRWWAAEVDAALVGFVGIRPSRDPIDPALGELDTIAVAPTYWRQGIGRSLLVVALSYLRADGYSQAVLWTLAHYAQGQRFYEAAGWKLDGGIRDAGRQVRYHHDLKA